MPISVSLNFEYHLFIIGIITIPTALLLLLHLGWKQFTHLVNAEGLNPNLTRPGHAGIEQAFTGTATRNATSHELDIQLYRIFKAQDTVRINQHAFAGLQCLALSY